MASQHCRLDHDHQHGTEYEYRHGCRCDDCRAWRAADYAETADFYKRRRHMNGADVHVNAVGTIRRLRALACLGWSAAELAKRTGYSEIHISRTRRGINGDNVTVGFATTIRRIYDELSMTKRDTHHGRKTMAVARKNGWLPPLAWDAIDDPQERPQGIAA